VSTTTATVAGEAAESRTPAVLALLSTSLIWGTAPLATKSVLEDYSPYLLASTRWAIAIAVMLVLLRRMGIRPVLDRRAVVLGLTGILLFNFFFSYGLERTSAANAALIGGALPVVIAVMSFLLLHERLSPLRWTGIAISMAGIAATVLGATLEASLLGNLLMFGSTFVWAIYTLYVRERMRGEAAMAITCGGAIYGLAMMIPFAAIEATQETYPAPDLGTIVQVIYLSVGPSMGAILLWSFALSRVPASTAGVFSNLAPIVGIVAAGIILSEPITRYHVIGAALVIAGVLVTTYRRRPAT
jgi:drug/metabolite transporter (DMT)-like permease